jgi:hypothetical protein
MTKNGSDGLFELSVDAGQEPYQESNLDQRSRFQSRAPRAGADYKAMAIERLEEAGAIVEGLDFEIHGFPVDAQVSGENGRKFLVLARGTPGEQTRSGLRRSDTVMKVGFVAMQLARCQKMPILLLVSDVARAARQSRVTISLRCRTMCGMSLRTEEISEDSTGCGSTYEVRWMASCPLRRGECRS